MFQSNSKLNRTARSPGPIGPDPTSPFLCPPELCIMFANDFTGVILLTWVGGSIATIERGTTDRDQQQTARSEFSQYCSRFVFNAQQLHWIGPPNVIEESYGLGGHSSLISTVAP